MLVNGKKYGSNMKPTPKSFPNLGFLETKLNHKAIKYLWSVIDKHKECEKHKLIGHISHSYRLVDENNWFFKNVLSEQINAYGHYFQNMGDSVATNQSHPYFLESFWVNFQKETEFNPLHDHSGVYSFVVWMKIPTDFVEQNKNIICNNKKASSFELFYTNTTGKISSVNYPLDSSYEGTLLFFPSQMPHSVYPFYSCKEYRISISGNIMLDTKKVFDCSSAG